MTGIIVAAIAAAGGPPFGAEVKISRQVVGRVGGIDGIEAAKLGVVEILPVAVLYSIIGGNVGDLLINDFTPLGSPNWLRMPRILANFWGVGYA
jgi:hypothetical protein